MAYCGIALSVLSFKRRSLPINLNNSAKIHQQNAVNDQAALMFKGFATPKCSSMAVKLTQGLLILVNQRDLQAR
ncbi:hypothetical protein THMIRHAT_11890 [Thiosulfativibrio zosterae]|uniref:Uncharacterized protein n=1 Tax=Thiosulfativibrio zosterae TaxID=2675053 RepID=A0A6F8PMV2_9GAMM|nr:hypothetical protein THMIRHAT_11890 [Thiosulfativibrio zosterae]